MTVGVSRKSLARRAAAVFGDEVVNWKAAAPSPGQWKDIRLMQVLIRSSNRLHFANGL
jgi:hypothetical protein